jgi:hypothetical protein
MAHWNWLKIIFAILAIIYFIYCAATPNQFHLAEGASMIIHEVGHVFFMRVPLPLFFEVASGTVFEFGFVILLMAYFGLKKDYYSVFIVLFILGLRLSYTSVYISDSINNAFPAFIPWPESGGSDWTWMLTQIGQLQNCYIIAAVVRSISLCVTAFAIIGTLVFAFKKEEEFRY